MSIDEVSSWSSCVAILDQKPHPGIILCPYARSQSHIESVSEAS